MKKIVSLIVLILTFSQHVHSQTKIGDLYYTFSGENATVVSEDASAWGGLGYQNETYNIPSTVTYNGLNFTVTAIGNYAFGGHPDSYRGKDYASTASVIKLPITIKSIGYAAFYACKNIVSMIIPPNVTYIGKYAFTGCDLLRELIYTGSVAPDGWFSKAKTYVPDLQAYSNPTYPGSDARIIEMISFAKHEFEYTGENPITTWTNNVEGYSVSLSMPSLNKNEGNHEVLIPATFTKGNESFTANIVYRYTIKPQKKSYTLSVRSVGNGSASYNGTTIKNNTQYFTLSEGSSATFTFTPDNGYRIKSVKVNNTDVSLYNNQYTISKINNNTTVEVEFEEIMIVTSMTVNGINYVVNDYQSKTIQVVAGDYRKIIDIPASVWYNDWNWTVIGIEQNALTNCPELAAIIWNPEVVFNARIDNPNLLLYVNDEKFAPWTVKNVVVNGIAESIELTDAANGNDFYCPRAFRAKSIVYSHNYQMDTGIGDSRGWETIVLPFDVQKYTHATKGELESFTTWSKGSNKKPFWLFELTTSGYKDVANIKANTPYIISLPNNQQYELQYQIPGVVTFSASNVEVQKSDNLKPGSYQGRSLVPNYANKDGDDCLALNVNNYYVTNPGKDIAGSKFIRGLRAVHPFEAYMTTTDNTRSIDVTDGMPTAIRGIRMASYESSDMKVYDTRGVLLNTATNMDDVRNGLKAGVYIVNGKKKIIK